MGYGIVFSILFMRLTIVRNYWKILYKKSITFIVKNLDRRIAYIFLGFRRLAKL